MDDNSTESRLVSTRCPSSGAVAVGQRDQDPDQRVQAGQDVDECDADLGGFIRFGSGDAHQSTDGLHQQVVAGQGGTSARGRTR